MLGIEPASGTVRVGPAAALDVGEITADRPVWSAGRPPAPRFRCVAQVRAHGGLAAAEVGTGSDRLTVRLDEPLRGVAPGQTVALYRPDPGDGDLVLGSSNTTAANERLGLGGLGVIIGSAYAARRGVTGGFLRDLDLRGAGLNRSQLVTRIGRLGWAALGVAYGIPGVLLVVAGLTYDPAVPTGLDAGLQRVSDEPYGPLLLVLLALGLVAFGVYCLFDARYRKA